MCISANMSIHPYITVFSLLLLTRLVFYTCPLFHPSPLPPANPPPSPYLLILFFTEEKALLVQCMAQHASALGWCIPQCSRAIKANISRLMAPQRVFESAQSTSSGFWPSFDYVRGLDVLGSVCDYGGSTTKCTSYLP